MSGHSKWSNIKRKKGALDVQKSKIFSQLSKQIRIAVKEGKSSDVNANPRLRLAVEKARAASMPNQNISRAIERAGGGTKGSQLEEIMYEGYAPHGVGVLLIAVTDNKMRTGSEIRSLFDAYGGSLAGPGAVQFLFDQSTHEYQVKIPLQLTPEQMTEIQEFVSVLEDHDDVEEVYHNAV